MLQVWLKREPADGAARSRKRRTIGSGRRTRKEIIITVITSYLLALELDAVLNAFLILI